MDTLAGFQRDLLYVVAGADQPSSQSIQTELDIYYKNEITHGRLYPNLDSLLYHDLVEKGSLDRRSNYYVITAAGETLIHERREWEDQYVDL